METNNEVDLAKEEAHGWYCEGVDFCARNQIPLSHLRVIYKGRLAKAKEWVFFWWRGDHFLEGEEAKEVIYLWIMAHEISSSWSGVALHFASLDEARLYGYYSEYWVVRGDDRFGQTILSLGEAR